ncbi:ribonuclease Z [Roseivivax sp. THAF40]|uniref:MBL fold metallo-hydrolase n=1 Tax=unclassified Roseivivax TaxID=2639302 RepID=UPI0012A8E6D9|nr:MULTISPECIES: MBL fold metallo-hydrolase [unclassified Roseivivax]QFS84527.1 ribonuclease Z [Roseivivax sp. THAF197b]QFT48355.1 ribonuclease Z [Roseivivax sp. THAF40]
MADAAGSVAILGVKGGPAIRPGSSMPTALLVQMGGARLLVDAGLGAARGVCDQGVALTALDGIVITHLHSDHYLELGPLLHTAWTAGLKREIPVWGPRGLAAYWQHFLASMAFDIELRIEDEGRRLLSDLVRIHEMPDEIVLGSLAVTATLNHHPPLSESYALSFAAGSKRVVFSGDTAPFEGWEVFCRGADLLIHEAMLEAGVDATLASLPHHAPELRTHILRSHTEAAEVGRLAAAADVGHLALMHFVPEGLSGFGPEIWESEVRRHYAGLLTLARDGVRLTL